MKSLWQDDVILLDVLVFLSQVGQFAMQVTFMDKTKILGMPVLLNDIYHASEIDEVR